MGRTRENRASCSLFMTTVMTFFMKKRRKTRKTSPFLRQRPRARDVRVIDIGMTIVVLQQGHGLGDGGVGDERGAPPMMDQPRRNVDRLAALRRLGTVNHQFAAPQSGQRRLALVGGESINRDELARCRGLGLGDGDIAVERGHRARFEVGSSGGHTHEAHAHNRRHEAEPDGHWFVAQQS